MGFAMFFRVTIYTSGINKKNSISLAVCVEQVLKPCSLSVSVISLSDPNIIVAFGMLCDSLGACSKDRAGCIWLPLLMFCPGLDSFRPPDKSVY